MYAAVLSSQTALPLSVPHVPQALPPDPELGAHQSSCRETLIPLVECTGGRLCAASLRLFPLIRAAAIEASLPGHAQTSLLWPPASHQRSVKSRQEHRLRRLRGKRVDALEVTDSGDATRLRPKGDGGAQAAKEQLPRARRRQPHTSEEHLHAMRSLADFLHLRNTSTSSTASASSTSTRSFGSPAHARSEEPQDLDHTRRQQASTPTKGQASGHTLAQSTSALHSIAAREELPTGTAGKRQRAASTDVVRLLGSQAGGSTPNLLEGRDVSVRSDAASVRSAYFAGSALAEEGREDLDAEPDVYRGQRQAPLFAPGSAQARSSRRAGGSVSSIGSVADAIAVGWATLVTAKRVLG